MNAVKDMIDDYLARGWIRPSSSSYGAPVIIISKNTWKLRIVIDYQLCNKQTRFDSYHNPRINELLDRLAHAKYLSKIYLVSRYHYIKIVDGHENKTAFLTRYGTYEWLVLPLGLINASATFQRLINEIICELLDKTLLVYLDDLLVYSDTDVQHLEYVKQVLQRLHDNKIYAKKKKI